MITNLNQLDPNKTYTYADYLSWRFTERVELLWGKIFKMSPAPSTNHQWISGILFREIAVFLKKSPCAVFHAPFDVFLKINDAPTESVVQPDIVVVCDKNKLDEKGCQGAPDLAIEVLSPSSAQKDMKYKLKLYEEAGVPEYWVVDPVNCLIQVFTLEAGEYQLHRPLTYDDNIQSKIITGLTIDLQEVFPEHLREPEVSYGENVVRM